jgi:hypothetical protein
MANSESTPPEDFGQRPSPRPVSARSAFDVRLTRIEAILAGLATKADLEVAITTAAADLATKADLADFATKADLTEAIAGVAKNVDVTGLGGLGEQQRDDIAGLKDDMSVLTAIIQRLDNSHTRLLTEIRATHAQVSRLADRVGRFDDRVHRLEEPPGTAG